MQLGDLTFLNEKNSGLDDYRAKYDERVDQKYIDEFYQVSNFQNIWTNSCQFFTSCEKAKKESENELKKYAKEIYGQLSEGNSDSMVMFDFTFYCDKEKYNIYPMMYIYKIHAEVLSIAKDAIISIRKTKNLDFRTELKKIDKRILDLYDTEENINLIFKLL